MGYIYSITNKIDGKSYVGQTIENDINDRWKSHLKSSSNCLYLKHALKKYKPENFKFEIICICFDEDCNKYEEEYIKLKNTLVPNGYNLKQGGNNGGKHHQETKLKIKETLKTFYKNRTPEECKLHIDKLSGQKNHNFGKKMPKKQKERMSKKIKESWIKGVYDKTKEQRLSVLKQANEKRKRKVEQYTLNDELINTFESISDVAKFINVTAGCISKCCNKKIRTCKGFVWKFVESDIKN